MHSHQSPAPCVAQASANRRDRKIGLGCGVVTVILFSGFTLASRFGLASSLALRDIALLRFTIGGILLSPLLFQRGATALRGLEMLQLAFLGGLGFALFAYSGFAWAPASHGAVLLHGTLPLFTFAIIWLTSRAPVRKRQVMGLTLIFVGVLAMAWDSSMSPSVHPLLGDLCLLLASACWSGYGVLAGRLGLKPAHAASIVAAVSMLCYLPLYPLLPATSPVTLSWGLIAFQAVFQGVFIGAVSIFVYTRAVASLGAAQTALFTAAVPCVTTIAAALLLAEQPTVLALCGVGIVTAGMLVAMRSAPLNSAHEQSASSN